MVVQLCLWLFTVFAVTFTTGSYSVGAGIYDITGPAAEIGMMGYAMTNQSSAGLHFRLRARAFVISDGQKRIVFVSTDSCMIYTAVKREVVSRLQSKFGPTLYTHENVMLSGTHTHSGPGGYSEYLIFDITTLGFHKENFETIVNGIVAAIAMAHNNMKANVNLLQNSGTLLSSNINRSPTAYLANPLAERKKYAHDVDKTMTLIRMQAADGTEVGLINWFAVHGTTMNNTNKLISGDNKGYASYLFERLKNGNNSFPGVGPFVAAFGQSNEGDVSPNTMGAFCWNGSPCEAAHSTCGGTSQGCHGYGPGKNNDNFLSLEIIGGNQFAGALALYNTAKTLIEGPISYVHTFVDMTNVVVTPKFTGLANNVTTCLSALGDSFAAGTTDGPGDFNFVQGTNSTSTNAYWNFIASFLSAPTPEQKQCQFPKPILLNTGGINFPSPWEPKILPLQILRIGSFVIIGVPGEFTTMSGRRLRETVSAVLAANGMPNSTVVIAGLANAYSHYISTHEEYTIQRYEAASTLFGPWTLAAYQQLYAGLAEALAKGTPVPAGPTPPNLSDYTITFQLPPIDDSPPLFKNFGDVDRDAAPSYARGSRVVVSFWGGNPRNNYLTQSNGFLTVEKLEGGTWKVLYNDGHIETKMVWERVMLAENRITITWDIPRSLPAGGQYRIRTFGYSTFFGALTPYAGTSRTFTLT